jgi:hypothetical protein
MVFLERIVVLRSVTGGIQYVHSGNIAKFSGIFVPLRIVRILGRAGSNIPGGIDWPGAGIHFQRLTNGEPLIAKFLGTGLDLITRQFHVYYPSQITNMEQIGLDM